MSTFELTSVEQARLAIGGEVTVNVFGAECTGTLTSVQDNGFCVVDGQGGTRFALYLSSAHFLAANEGAW